MSLFSRVVNMLAVLIGLLGVIGLGSLVFIGEDEAPEVQSNIPTAEYLNEKWAEEKGTPLVFRNASVEELLEFMDMREPSPWSINAPGFELISLDGNTVTIEQLRGKTVLLGFWTTW